MTVDHNDGHYSSSASRSSSAIGTPGGSPAAVLELQRLISSDMTAQKYRYAPRLSINVTQYDMKGTIAPVRDVSKRIDVAVVNVEECVS